MFKVRLAIINYGLTSEEHAAAAAAILGIIRKAEILLKRNGRMPRNSRK